MSKERNRNLDFQKLSEPEIQDRRLERAHRSESERLERALARNRYLNALYLVQECHEAMIRFRGSEGGQVQVSGILF